MICHGCDATVDVDSPDADGWLRVTLARRDARFDVEPAGAVTRQLEQVWLCSLPCVA